MVRDFTFFLLKTAGMDLSKTLDSFRLSVNRLLTKRLDHLTMQLQLPSTLGVCQSNLSNRGNLSSLPLYNRPLRRG